MAGAVPMMLGSGLLFGLGKKLFPKAPKAPGAPMAPTRDAAAEAARRGDDFRRRRGFGANVITGGAEAPGGGGKTLLGQ